ncbi:MAG TPA: sigma-70 family RNA polymerase sigma factor, partial [Kofleriaceae bacterium]|nr:sigma-70 family RNA polymerase sigma factor [Kofleriaceae bacterium]
AMDPATSDADLLLAWQAGNEVAGEALVERYFDRLYRFFHTKLDAEADELVQATFLACLGAKDRFRRESSFRTFLFGIARNQLYAALRGRAKAARLDFAVSSIAELVSTPRTRLARHQDYERLVAAMRQLPLEQQTLLELHYWDELGMAELAAVFETSEVNIRSRLHRARKALRELLETSGERGEAAALDAMDQWARSLSGVRPR